MTFHEWLYFEMPGQGITPEPNWQRLLDLTDEEFKNTITTAFANHLPKVISGYLNWQYTWDSTINDPLNSIDFQKYFSKEIILQALTGSFNP